MGTGRWALIFTAVAGYWQWFICLQLATGVLVLLMFQDPSSLMLWGYYLLKGLASWGLKALLGWRLVVMARTNRRIDKHELPFNAAEQRFVAWMTGVIVGFSLASDFAISGASWYFLKYEDGVTKALLMVALLLWIMGIMITWMTASQLIKGLPAPAQR